MRACLTLVPTFSSVLLKNMYYLVVAHQTFGCSMQTLSHSMYGVLATGPPGKCPQFNFSFLLLFFWGSPGGAGVKNSSANVGDAKDSGSILGLGRSSGGGNGNPLQYSCLGNPMDRGAWGATVHGVSKESDKTELICHVTLFFYLFPLDYTPLVCAVHFSFSVIFIPVSLADTYGNEDV